MHLHTFDVRAVAFPSDENRLDSLVTSLGSSLGLYERPPSFAMLSFGRFGDGGAPIRVSVADPDDPFRLRRVLVPMFRAAFRNSTSGIELSEPRDDEGWLEKLCSEELGCVDLHLPVPLLTAGGGASHWMADFLQEVGNIKGEPVGISLMLRPTVQMPRPTRQEHQEGGYRKNPWFRLREIFENIPIESTSDQSTKRREKSSQTSTRQYSTSGEMLRQRGLARIDEMIATPGWWVGVRAFGREERDAQQVASAYWAALSRLLRADARQKDRANYPTPTFMKSAYDNRDVSWARVAEGNLTFGEREAADPARIRTALRESGIDLAFHTPTMSQRIKEETEESRRGLAACEHLMIPHSNEMLVSGERLSTLFQLPVRPNPLLRVIRGYSYCAVPSASTDGSAFEIGHVGRGGLFVDSSGDERSVAAQISFDELTKHALVVGATGCGKTTTMISLLSALKKSARDVQVTVLEGAKTEYRDHATSLGIDADSVYDFARRPLPLNIFEHPPFVSPEEHISQLSAIFDATLDMPAPMPAIMKEALTDAYASYHEEEKPEMKGLHPIRYWLLKSAKVVGGGLGYQGENQATIKGALRTRLGSLATGSAGKVLAGGGERQSWKHLRHILSTSAILELEGIADRHARSLIMSLFVLYFRYAIREEHRTLSASEKREIGLSHVLVLEEAHRIIGKGKADDDASLEYFANILSEIRAYGCGVIIVDQSPSRLIDDAMRNTNTKIIMRLVSGDDIRSATVGAGLPDEATQDIPRLRPGEAILVSSDKLPRVIRIHRREPEDAVNSLLSAPPAVAARVLRRELANDTALAQLYFDVMDDLYTQARGRRPTLKQPFERFGEYFRRSEHMNDPKELLDWARLGVGCTCELERPEKQCEDHREEPALWVFAQIAAGKVPKLVKSEERAEWVPEQH